MTSERVSKLSDPAYRKAFIASQINIGIPFQIRALMKARGWKQEELAQKADMLQPRISGLMTPGKTRPNIDTLRRLAEAFDCGLIVRFAPFSELARWSGEFDPESFTVPDFDHDTGFATAAETHEFARTRKTAIVDVVKIEGHLSNWPSQFSAENKTDESFGYFPIRKDPGTAYRSLQLPRLSTPIGRYAPPASTQSP